MKKSTKAGGAKKLLLSAQKVRELTSDDLQDVVGGLGCGGTVCDNGSCKFSRVIATG